MSEYTKKMKEVLTDLKVKVDQVAQSAATVFETDNLSMIYMRIEDTLEELEDLEA